MARVVEYLGLPGVGKTSQLGEDGYCAANGAHPSPVPDGQSFHKLVNTFRGLLMRKRLFFLLLWSGIQNWRTLELRTSLRPIFVVFERIGRTTHLRQNVDLREIHIDEGSLQFVWRTFFEKELNESNLRMLSACMNALGDIGSSVCYISCRREEHVSRVLNRGKQARFDLSVAQGDEAAYKRGRLWMAAILRILRCSEVDIVYVHASD